MATKEALFDTSVQHTDHQILPSSRREFSLYAAKLFGLIAARTHLANPLTLYPLAETAQAIGKKVIDIAPTTIFLQDTHEQPKTSITTYTQEQLEQTRIFGLGDSIAEGFQGVGKDPFAAAQVIADTMKTHQHQWTWENEAWGGAKTEAVFQQLDAMEKKIQGSRENIDIILSIGGNDLAHIIAQSSPTRNPSYFLTHDPTYEDFERFVGRLKPGIENYQFNLYRILRRISQLQQNDARIGRVYLLGLANMKHAKDTTTIDTQGIPTTLKYPEDFFKKLLAQQFAQQLSKVFNKAMTDVIVTLQQRRTIGYDVVFIDTSDLTNDDFTDVHPSRQGQRVIAQKILSSGRLILPDGTLAQLPSVVVYEPTR